ncbi:MAG: ABC transporter ATP-binding protein [Nibricoccus sp.]
MRRFFPYFKYLRKVRFAIAGGVLCGILYAAVGGLGAPLMVKYVFPRVLSADPVTPPKANGENDHKKNFFQRWISFDPDRFFDRMFGIEAAHPPQPSTEVQPAPVAPAAQRPKLTTWQIWMIALWLPTVFALRGIAGYFNTYLIQHAGIRILEQIRLDYFRKMQHLPLGFFHKLSSGEMIARGLGDTNQLQTTLTIVSNDLIKQPFTLISTLLAVAWIAYQEQGLLLVLVCLLTVPLAVFPIRYVGKKLLSRAVHLQAQAGNITSRFTENLSAAKEVRAFGLEAHEVERFSKLGNVIVRAQMKVVKYAQILTPSIEILAACGIAVTFVYAYQCNIHSGSFLGILTALYLSYEPLKKLGAISNELKRGEASLSRLEEVLNEPITIVDPANPVEIGRCRGNIAFDKVEFAYKAGDTVLREVSIDIPAGTVCALVGPSGAGKTTFVNLVPRFYEVSSGGIKVDGHDVRQMRLADLRRNIAIVSQDPVLFNETIYQNILLGRPEATRAEVEQAARDAFAHDFIVNLEGGLGYDTVVGERGSRLSGGQRQRIAIARAFLRNAPILILDEATSALDSDSEAFVHAALKKLMIGKTVLIIAHRFSTIRDASMILVFEKGKLVASGSHAAVYESSPMYRSLYDKQSLPT